MSSTSLPTPVAAITNLGCKVNQSELEAIGRLLRERGVRVTSDGEGASLHLVNTCTVTAEADAKSRAAVRRARRTSPEATIVATGCSVSVDPATYGAVDEAAILVDNDAKGTLPGLIADVLGLPDDEAWVDGRPLSRPLPTLSGPVPVWTGTAGRDRSVADRARAFVKVQDGCSFYCTYCLIPRARGAERSLAPETVLADVRRAVAAGHREVVLTGINIGTYDGGSSERGFRGSHRRSALTLAGLVRRILAETDVERLRLSSIEPQHVDDELLAAWVDGVPRTLPHLHLPLQSGDDGVLRRMGRRYDAVAYAGIVARARAALPGLALHADVMAGFPSEDDAAHARSLAFIRSLEPAGLHVFRYSERPGTAAIRMAAPVDPRTRRRRAAELLALAAEARARFARRAIGHQRSVLVEEPVSAGRWIGRSEDYIEVLTEADNDLRGTIVRVTVEGIDPTADDRVIARPDERVGAAA